MDTHEWIEALKNKYEEDGQDINSYLEGLYHARYITYWDYIQHDALLNLQHPRTEFPDEMIFIIYHQITELYFKLSLWELNQINDTPGMPADLFREKVRRVNNYFNALKHSFGIMIHGMEKEQFLKFRMTLTPASGFQSIQYRMVEFSAAPLNSLIQEDKREELANASIEEKFNYIYWKKGAIIEKTGEKTLTLKEVEKYQTERLLDFIRRYNENNVWKRYLELPEADQQDEKLITELKELDLNVNVRWPLVHYRSAVQYLKQGEGEKADATGATGGTNWPKYLAPRIQRRIFFPDLWTEKQRENWGSSELEFVNTAV